MTETVYPTLDEAAAYATAHEGVVTFLPASTRLRPTPARWRVTTLPAPSASRHEGYTDVPMWATDVRVGTVINERSNIVVTHVDADRPQGGIAIETPDAYMDFPVTGIITRTVRDPQSADLAVGCGGCGAPADHECYVDCIDLPAMSS